MTLIDQLYLRNFQTGPNVRIAIVPIVPVELGLSISDIPVGVRNLLVTRELISILFFLITEYHLHNILSYPTVELALYKTRHAISILWQIVILLMQNQFNNHLFSVTEMARN